MKIFMGVLILIFLAIFAGGLYFLLKPIVFVYSCSHTINSDTPLKNQQVIEESKKEQIVPSENNEDSIESA